MKKLINQPADIIFEMMEGMCAAHPFLEKVQGMNVIKRQSIPKKVGLVSGGGSGHEPAHAGFVGKGMLDAAVIGEVFTSPTPDQVLAGIQAVDQGMGVLLVIKNYTGDVMNFEMAVEMAQLDDIRVAKVIVDDDIAVKDSTYTIGRRGVAGTIFIHKIAGAAAEANLPLVEVTRIAQKVVSQVKTLGMSLGPCIVPATGKPSFALADNEIEMGLGIHGEPGTHREALKPIDTHVDYMLAQLLQANEIKSEDRVAVIINGLGGTPLMELYVISRRVHSLLKEKSVVVADTWVGNYMTALEMPGFSISILKLDDELEMFLLAACQTAALVRG